MDFDLYCRETAENEIKAYDDPALLQDRVLKNLLKTEDRYVLQYPVNFHKVQQEVTIEMRKIVAEWMMEVCEEQKCQDEVFLLAMNYMDRFLMCCSIMKNQLQLLGTACMLIASKLREPRPLSAETLVYYTDHSVSKQHLRMFELLVLSKLKWDMAAVTPQDFLKHLLKRLPLDRLGFSYEMVNNHAKTIIALCARDFTFSPYHPSIIACASVASALDGIGWTRKLEKTKNDLLEELTKITNIEKEYVSQCLMQIDNMIRESSCGDSSNDQNETSCDDIVRPDEFTPPPRKVHEHETSVTPRDVHDVHF